MFKEGQEVWDVLRGKGRVAYVSNDGVLVAFPSHGKVLFTHEGSIGGGFKRTLFFSEPKIEAALTPPWIPKLKKGDKVCAVNKLEQHGFFGIVVEDFESYVNIEATSSTIPVRKDLYNIYKLQEKSY